MLNGSHAVGILRQLGFIATIVVEIAEITLEVMGRANWGTA